MVSACGNRIRAATRIVMDAPNGRTEWNGFKPSERAARRAARSALASTSPASWPSSARTSRRVSAERTANRTQIHPGRIRHIDMVFTVHGTDLNERAVERALTLAVERYCSVGASLAGTATITHRVVVISARPAAVAA